ncbi:cytochrome c biogenesis protein CcdA [Corynebacterium incognita]|uniref:Cytochrome c biogenesis protein CcdA n=1 Tax=Corynebacterium incognita TaxID=2754725 RepID=A0A7G7CMH5_9CORY|nr:cytochrome c biogenesis CcdA family protein [Corynebacterium incognita]QNE88791.1 cytochrome c biogenesis protein CcdA [Corynebacterium incognita]
MTIGMFGALVAGVLSLLSPCSALLLPAFFAYAFTSLRQLATKTLFFFLGLATVLVPIGTGLGAIAAHRDTVIMVGGWVMIALGVFTFFGGGFSIPGLSALSAKARGHVFLLGTVYGFAGFCAGPMLGAVLTTATVSGSALYGAAIMALYALGMTLPLFVLALLWDRFNLADAAWLRGKFAQRAAGVLFVVIGVLFLTTHGTSALPGILSTDTQFAIQEWAQRMSTGLSDATLWFIVSVTATFLLAIKLARTSSRA